MSCVAYNPLKQSEEHNVSDQESQRLKDYARYGKSGNQAQISRVMQSMDDPIDRAHPLFRDMLKTSRGDFHG